MKFRRYQLLSFQTPSLIPYWVLGGALVVTFAAAFYVHRTAPAKDRSRFDNSVKQIITTLDGRLDTYKALLRAGTGLFAASHVVEPGQVHRFVAAVGFAQRDPAGRRIALRMPSPT